jgi:hypothetical protein
MRFCIVNTAVSCQLYTSTNLILICFQNICFEKEVSATYFSAHMNVFMLKNKISIFFKVNGNLKSEILTVEKRGDH